MNSSNVLPVLALVVSCAAPALAADLDAVVGGCNACHGDDGVSRWTDVPTIAGMPEITHADALYIYRDGDRPCAESRYRQGDASRAATSMCEVAGALSDETIDQLAAHYAGLSFVPAKQDFDAELAGKGAALHKQHCDRCHSEGGSNPDDEAGILAGQWMGYLQTTFDQYRADERDQPGNMKEKMDALSDDDAKALIHYYASQQ